MSLLYTGLRVDEAQVVPRRHHGELATRRAERQPPNDQESETFWGGSAELGIHTDGPKPSAAIRRSHR